jgi:putative sigma-54 modulation protein
MNLTIQSVHFDADHKLKEHIAKKIEKLNQFHDRIGAVNIYLKLDNIVHTIKDKVVEIKVAIPRHEFFVKQTCKSFEASFDQAMEAIINQIKRKKDKEIA